VTEPQAVIYEDPGAISPFWQRLPWFFRFPFQTDVLVKLLLLSLATLLAPIAPLPAPLDSLLVGGLVWLAGLRQAFGVMEAVSQGRLTARERSTFQPGPERKNLPWDLLAIFLTWGALIALVGGVSTTLHWTMLIFFCLGLPASVMTLSVSNSLRQALNPVKWVFLMRQVGKPYLLLLFYLLLLTKGAPYAQRLLLPRLGDWLILPALTWTLLYFTLIMFAMMGYVLYQFHQALGLKVRISFARSSSNPAARAAIAQADPMAEAVANKVATGELDAAIDIADEQRRQYPEDLAIQERYQTLLLAAGRTERALAHGQTYLGLLLRLGRAEQALDLLKRLRGVDGAFLPERPDAVLPLAEAAFSRRDADTTVALVRGFDKRHPRHPDIPGVYFLSARLMSELLRRDPTALTILRGLQHKYPEHPVTAAAAPYLAALEKLQPGRG
jgi:tetratricopeptide (TPR) repeat protein